MTQHKPTGWNTWDFRGCNRFSYLAAGKSRIALRYAIWDESVPPPTPDSREIGKLYDKLRWDDVIRLGPHAALGLPAELDFKVGGASFRTSAWSQGDTFHLDVQPLTDTQMRIVFILDEPLSEHFTAQNARAARFAGFDLEFDGAAPPGDYYLNIAEPFAVGQPGMPASVSVKPQRGGGAGDPSGPGTLAHYESNTLSGSGALANAPRAMNQAVTWNTLFDNRRRLVSSPVSRDWCYDWRGVLVFCWDTFFVGTFASYESNELARLNFEAVTAAIDEMGFVPNYYMAHGAASRDRSMPPLGSYAILKTQRANPDLKWLRGMYTRLRRWHEFWHEYRDGNDNGLYSWGSNTEPHYEFKQIEPYNGVPRHTRQSAMYESGLDNSPLFDDVTFNEQTCTLELDDIGLSSYVALDCECLAEIATLLGKKSEAEAYRQEHDALARRINEHLWDEEHGIYCDRHWDGRFSRRWAPTSFFPLLAGVAPRDRAERLVNEHLLNESEFWGQYVLPSIARSDPAYADNDYWRGRIWGPFNYLTCEALRRNRFDDVATELATRSLNLFMDNWRRDGGVYENYNADTGAGADVWNAARLYHWGGMLAFMGLQELIDVEPCGFLRFGSLAFPDSGLKNVRISGDDYEIALDEGIHARRNGQPLIDCTTRAIVRLPLDAAGEKPIEVSASGNGQLTVHDGDPSRPVTLNGQTRVEATTASGAVRYTW